MRFVFPVLFSVMIALLFVSFYARWPSPLRVQHQQNPICQIRYKSSQRHRHLRPT